MATSCRFLVFVLLWLLPLMLVAAEEQQGGGCSAKRCGNLTVSYPFWLPDMEAARSCGSLDFEVDCFNDSTPILRSSASTGFAIMDISYEFCSLRVVDVHKEENFKASNSCRFPRWNTSRKLGVPFKINPANLNLIFYNCTETATHQDRALVKIGCVDASNAFVRAGVPYDVTGNYASYALEGCDATVVPVMGSSSSSMNASHYKQLISDGFLLTWDETPHPAPARYFPLYALATYVVYATTTGAPIAIQDGVYAVGAGGYGGFFPTWVAA